MTAHANTVYVDLDGTLCRIKSDHERYEDLAVREDVVRRLHQAHEDGYRIVVHTSRSMRTYNGDLSAIISKTAPTILDWLNRHKVPFDGLLVGKPWPGPRGFYVDDRTVRPDEFVALSNDSISEMLRETP